MRIPLAGALAAIATAVNSPGLDARAAVDLELRAGRETFGMGSVVDVGLYAVSEEGTVFSALDVLITWDPAVLELSEPAIDDGPHDWNFVFGFLSDEQLDRLNADCGGDVFCDPYTELPFNDGDAMFQAASFSSATPTAEGILVATFRFNALSETPLTEIAVVETLGGQYAVTRVLPPGGQVEVTGNLGSASITILGAAALTAWDLSVPAGRMQPLVVSGTISDRSTYAVTVMAELVPRPGNAGTVTFTEAPPVDILQVGDPWPTAGVFTPYDTDLSSSSDRNGSVDDNGEFTLRPVTFSGPLTVFPVVTSPDAWGVWDVRLSTSYGVSTWEQLDTTLRDGTLIIVELGDVNGDAAIDMFDFSKFQLCFTGRLDPIDPPAYALTPGLSCGVYDFDDDGDIDDFDYAAFQDVALGPAP